MKTSVAVMRSLAAIAIVAFTIWTSADAEKVMLCCVSVSRSRVVEPLKSFRLLESSPPCVKAVIFETERGYICIDPRQPWVRKKIEEFSFETERGYICIDPRQPWVWEKIEEFRVVEPLKVYSLQDRSPPCVKAVIFETENERYCLDASQPWVQEKIEELIRQQKTTVSPTSVSPHLTFSAPEKTSQKKDEPSSNYYCYTTALQP
ncbi:hypothetical protein MHYP_G00290740 [Metynnis hypsauchen]